MVDDTNRRIAFLYPGQGAIPEALPPSTPQVERLLAIAASHDVPLAEWIPNGDERLGETRAMQPAILIDSLVRDAVLRQSGLVPAFVAGHSLGEYAALVGAGVLSAEGALDLVCERGRLMNRVDGAMAAIVKLAPSVVEHLCDDVGSDVVIANRNGPRQLVVTGTHAAVARVVAEAEAVGGRGIRLRVSGPFHSPFMKPAEDALAPSIARTTFSTPSVPVVSAVSGGVEQDPGRLRTLLTVQITSCVRWVDVVDRLASSGVTHAVEIGSGSVLTNLGRRITEKIAFLTYEEAADGVV